jgi:hypothetical protein
MIPYYGGYGFAPQGMADLAPQGFFGGLSPLQVDPWASYYGQTVAPQSFMVPQSIQESETQASNAFYEDAAAELIRHLYEYLNENSGQYKELKDITPLLQRSADLYEARNFQGAFLQLQQVYRFIIQLRSKVQGVPIP